MSITTVAYPSAPAITPLKGTLLDVADVREGIAWLDGKDLYHTFNCMGFVAQANFCAPSSKNFDQVAGWEDGFRFAVYGGVICKAPGLDEAQMRSESGRVFAAKESLGVERGFMATRFIDGGIVGDWDAPTNITPAGGAVSASVGVGLLESHAASIYAGQPTLHMPRVIATLLAQKGALTWDGNNLVSALQSKIAAGGGYDLVNTGPTGAAAPTGEKWIYATGEVLILRSETVSVQEMNRSTNEVLVLVERAYVGSADCYAAAVRVKVE